jgi:threonine synthase
MGNFIGYRCSLCSSEYRPDEVTYTCPKDGGNLDVVMDYARLGREYSVTTVVSETDYSIWRYILILPVHDPDGRGTPLRSVGWTPVYTPEKMTSDLGLENLWIKDESCNPSASFKDRASALVVARAREIGAETVITASTGNAGAALAGMAAAMGDKAVILAPKSAPPAKVAQLLVYGAKVILVEGNYDQAFDLSIAAANEFGWYCRNSGYNPFTAEGKKTGAFEIWEQVLIDNTDLKKPLCVFTSVGDGNIISGLHKGFKDLLAMGWIDSIPRIFGVQAEGSAAIANAFLNGTETIQSVTAQTIADSISVDLPRDGVRAIRAARDTRGDYIVVKDDDILKAITELGKAGIFAEPAGAASYAGLVKAIQNGKIHSDDPVLVLVTGSGLKDVKAAMLAAGQALVIEPTLKALKKVI